MSSVQAYGGFCPGRFNGGHVPSPNPRHDGRCLTCGQPAPSVPRRNRLFERDLVDNATRGVMHPEDSERLLVFCWERSKRLSGQYVEDWLDIRPGLARDREAREEAADGVNHCLFALQEYGPRELDDHRLNAIRYFALAWEELRKAEDAA